MNPANMKSTGLLFILPLLLCTTRTSAQNSVWDQWDSEVVSGLYTSRDIPY